MRLAPKSILENVVAASLIAAAVILYRKRAEIAAAFNPTSDKNLAYKGANSLLQFVTGNKIDSVGTTVANAFPSAAEQKVNAMLSAPVLSKNLAISTNPFDVKATSAAYGGPTSVEPFLMGLGAMRSGRQEMVAPVSKKVLSPTPRVVYFDRGRYLPRR